jgi:peptidoglycan-N-acetylglucosamine deacetylase
MQLMVMVTFTTVLNSMLTVGNTLIIILLIIVLNLSWLTINVFSIRYSVFLRSICRIPTSEKIVFLSFDDGPSAQFTPLILNTLQLHQIKATFFCIGHHVEAHPELVKRIFTEGHLVGNHSYLHGFAFTIGCSAKVQKELSRTTAILQSISNQEITLFRPPFGVSNPAMARAVRKLNLTSVGWDVRSFDTLISDPEKLKMRIIKRIRPGSIILLHDNRAITAEILGDLVDRIGSNGYKIVPLTAFLNPG